jgi:Domain of unknown function (DUF4157)
LAVSDRGDVYEQEADRLAEQVTRMAEPRLQGACACGAECPQCQQEQERWPTMRVGSSPFGQTVVPPIVYQVLRTPGQPLDPAPRAFMERRFGHDLSRVRVHTDGRAATAAASIGARAYTSGYDVVFGAGQFQPEAEWGRRLLAHELAHVGQQTSSSALSEGSGRQHPPAIQRDGPERPSAPEEAAERAHSESLQDVIHEKYWAIHLRVANAEAVARSAQRQQWLRRLEAESGVLERLLTSKEPIGVGEVGPLATRLEQLQREVNAENQAALRLWEATNGRYAEERERLTEAGDYESELAAGFLDDAFDQSEKQIAVITGTDALVRDDVLPLVSILDRQTHLKSARSVAERERTEAAAQLDELSQVQEEGPGLLETAWSIIGCESVGECLGDVALTVATAGTGKALKATIKGAKAAHKAQKARKIVRSTEKLGTTLHKVLKQAKALDQFVGVVKGSAVEAATTYGKWLKKDWKSIRTKISTDWIANYTTGEGLAGGTVAVARINKEFIGTLVANELGIPKADPEFIKVAIIFFMRKKRKTAASLVRTFILQSLKYRTVVNLSFESLRATTPLTERDEIFRRTLISTAGECAQDTVQAIPFVAESGLAKYLTETMRKMVQQIFG